MSSTIFKYSLLSVANVRVALAAIGILGIVLQLFGGNAVAQTPKNKGLLVSPLRQYITVDSGTQKNGTVRVSNLTDSPMRVVFSVESFSVTDYAYDYKFALPPKNDWVKLSVNETTLKPNEQKSIAYTLTVPKSTAPSGNYYTIFATQSKDKGSVTQQVRVGSLLYVTVNGVAQQSSTLVGIKIPRITLNRELTTTQDIRNTGNVHFFVYAYHRLSGAFGVKRSTGTSHILLPDATRRITTTTELPWMPGLYSLHTGYTSELAKPVDTARLVLYIPIWFIIILATGLAVFARYWFAKRRKKHTPKDH
jgi:hypothetical protein